MILNIYFKNIGQGDTIIMDWNEGTSPEDTKYGIIDCNHLGGTIKPVAEHIRDHNIRVFEFAILSHPHYDHFSGFPDFLELCKSEGIFIKEFCHTAPLDPRFLSTLINEEIKTKSDQFRQVTLSVNHKRYKGILWRFFKELRKQHYDSRGYIEEVYLANSRTKDIKLTKDISLCFLAPENSYHETELYFKKSYSATDEEKQHLFQKYENNPHANFLSSLLQLKDEKNNWQVLFSSDVTDYTLDRIVNNKKLANDLLGKKTLAVQVPHHGSEKNHVEDFWSRLNGIGDAYAFVSAGDGYGHPDYAVVEFFDKTCRELHCTNNVGGFRDYVNNRKGAKDAGPLSALFSLPGIDSTNYRQGTGVITEDSTCGEKHIRIIQHQNGLTEYMIVP